MNTLSLDYTDREQNHYTNHLSNQSPILANIPPATHFLHKNDLERFGVPAILPRVFPRRHIRFREGEEHHCSSHGQRVVFQFFAIPKWGHRKTRYSSLGLPHPCTTGYLSMYYKVYLEIGREIVIICIARARAGIHILHQLRQSEETTIHGSKYLDSVWEWHGDVCTIGQNGNSPFVGRKGSIQPPKTLLSIMNDWWLIIVHHHYHTHTGFFTWVWEWAGVFSLEAVVVKLLFVRSATCFLAHERWRKVDYAMFLRYSFSSLSFFFFSHVSFSANSRDRRSS